MTVEERSVTLQPGDLLLVYTDGITDARDERGRFFGVRRLRDALRANRSQPADEVIKAILETVQAFVGGAPPADDVTLLAVRRDAAEAQPSTPAPPPA